MKRLSALLLALIAVPAFGQYVPMAVGGYSFASGTWAPLATTTSINGIPASALNFQIGLYCFNSGTGLWYPSDSNCLGGGGGGGVQSITGGTGISVTGTTTPTVAVNTATVPLLASNNAWTGNETHSGTEGFSGIVTDSATASATAGSFNVVGGTLAAGGATVPGFVYIAPSGGTTPTFNSGGEILSVNAPSGFGGNIFSLTLNGAAAAFSVSSAGNATVKANLSTKGLATAALIKTGAYTATTADMFLGCNAATAGFTITLNASATTGQIYIIKKTDATANVCTVSSNGKNIDGAASTTLTTQYQVIRVIYDGTTYNVI